jgi:magnesium chelatase subunit I
MIDLPLGATEDRVCGTIDIEKALTEGIKAFEPGLLAKANRGLLYVDEVNLLDDHLVDILLDSAASGWNTVEREEFYQTSGTFCISWIRKPGRRRITSTAIR